MPAPTAYRLIDLENETRDDLLESVRTLDGIQAKMLAHLEDHGHTKIRLTVLGRFAHTPMDVSFRWTGAEEQIPPGWAARGEKMVNGWFDVVPVGPESMMAAWVEQYRSIQPSPYDILRASGVDEHQSAPGEHAPPVCVCWHAGTTGVWIHLNNLDGTQVELSDDWEQAYLHEFSAARDS